MSIGIDFDSTIAKIDQPLLDRLNRVRGTVYRAEDWSDWDLTFLPIADRDLLFRLLTLDFYDTVMPYPHAAESIAALSKIPGVELVCVTANPQHDSDAFTKAKTRLWSMVDFAKTKAAAELGSSSGLAVGKGVM
jgi:5'(3')-deoxyribonucleotidase